MNAAPGQKPSKEQLHRDLAVGMDKDERPRAKNRLFGWVIIILVLAGVFAFWKWRHSEGNATEEGGGGRRHGGMGMQGPVPIVSGQVATMDFPLYADGLGTVQAYNSVTVKVRVDGELEQILFQEGQTVQQGQVIAKIDPRPYQAQFDQAKAKKLQDEAQLANAQTVLARNDQLIKNKVIDQQTYDAQKYSTQQLQALVAADQAAIDNAQTELNYTDVTAPITGRVGIRLVDAGNIVKAADTTGIVVINQIQPISVVFTLPQQDLKDIRAALLANKELKVLALDRDNESTLAEGKLEVLDNQIDPTTATVKLKAVFENKNYELWPGQFVNVRLLLGNRPGALVVPTQAVQRGPTGTYVYVITAESKAVMRDVTIGPSEDDKTLIEKGLQAGEKVVNDGQYKLQDGSQVTEATDKPGAAPAGGGTHHRAKK